MRWGETEEISESTRKIGNRILRDAREQADKILQEAKKKTDAVIDDTKKTAEEAVLAEEKSLRDRSEEIVKRRSAELEVDEQRRLMNFRSEIVGEVFKKVLEQLEEYTETPEYATTLKALIGEAASTLGGGKLAIQVNSKDRKLLTRKALEELADEVQERAGNETSLELSKETGGQIGGAIVSTVDGAATIDNTFEARIERIRENNQLEIETILFGQS